MEKTDGEIFDFVVWQLRIDPSKGGVETRAVLLHEVTQVRHAGQLVQMRWG